MVSGVAALLKKTGGWQGGKLKRGLGGHPQKLRKRFFADGNCVNEIVNRPARR
jgi:hypothetical protein